MAQEATTAIAQNKCVYAEDAGTVFRFSLALAASEPLFNNMIFANKRLMERPILPLIEILRSWGAEISIKPEGLLVKGIQFSTQRLFLPPFESSQFITALLLIAPKFGLSLSISPFQTSYAYINQTILLMQTQGFDILQNNTSIAIKAKIPEIKVKNDAIELDWSAASYFFSMAIISPVSKIFLNNLDFSKLQGDSIFIKNWIDMGIFSIEKSHGGIVILGSDIAQIPKVIDFSDCPDISMNFIFAMALKNLSFDALGLGTLNNKESKRLLILHKALQKMGVNITSITENSISISGCSIDAEPLIFNAYQDHRLAMTFAQYALIGHCSIEQTEAVNKSFPQFWEQLSALNYEIT